MEMGWGWDALRNGVVYEGMATTWDHLESSCAKLTFGRHLPQELRTAYERPPRRYSRHFAGVKRDFNFILYSN